MSLEWFHVTVALNFLLLILKSFRRSVHCYRQEFQIAFLSNSNQKWDFIVRFDLSNNFEVWLSGSFSSRWSLKRYLISGSCSTSLTAVTFLFFLFSVFWSENWRLENMICGLINHKLFHKVHSLQKQLYQKPNVRPSFKCEIQVYLYSKGNYIRPIALNLIIANNIYINPSTKRRRK